MFPSTDDLHRCYLFFGNVYIVDVYVERDRDRDYVYLRLYVSQVENPPDKTNEGSGKKSRKTHPVCISIDSFYIY